MKLSIATDYLDPIKLGQHEWVSVCLPDGRTVTVFDDRIYVATEQETRDKKDGKRIWEDLRATDSVKDRREDNVISNSFFIVVVVLPV